ncbi:MAG: ArsR/SmtB family transcription factor [Acidiferrobacter sp.]
MADTMQPKRLVFEQLAQVAKALAQGGRLELLEALAQGERGVDDLAHLTGMSIANTSHHLQTLRNGGFVTSRKSGVQVYYRLTGDEVTVLLSALQSMGERHVARIGQIVSEHFTSVDTLTPISHKELLPLLRAGQATVVDVRPEREYLAGHVKGALSIPLEQLTGRLAALPKSREVVAYCRGPYCLLAFEAVQELRRHGFRARRLHDGFPEWKASRLPLATGDDKAPSGRR